METDIIQTVKNLFDVGGVVVVTVMLWIVWRRLNELTDRLIDLLDEMRISRVLRGTESPPQVDTRGKSKETET